MRLAYTSDLHVDHHPEVVGWIARRAREVGAETLVIAGDVSPRRRVLEESLRELADAAPRVVFVAGNHDLWCAEAGPDSRARYLHVIPELCARAGVACLHHGPIEAGGVTLVGQTGWYDGSLRDRAYDAEIPAEAYCAGRFGRLEWMDRRFIRWPSADDDAALAAWMAERLAADLARAPRDRPAVVVTHVLPFDQLAPRPPLPFAFVRAFLGATALGDAIVAAADAGLPVWRVLAGHTHFRRRAVIARPGGGVVAAETSPVGYPREYRRLGIADLPGLAADRVRVLDVEAAA